MDQSKEPEKFNVGGAGRLLLKVEKDKLQSLNPWFKDRLTKVPMTAGFKTKKTKQKLLTPAFIDLR